MILTLLLLALVLFFIYRYTRRLKINVYYNKKSKIAPLVGSIERFKRPYFPTPYLFNCHIHTLYAMQFRKRAKFTNEREKVIFPDGGNAIIDWFHPKDEKTHNDIIVIFHTLGGGSREKCVHAFGVACAKKGYTACVLNCRGCAGAKLTSDKIYNAYEIHDFKYSIDNYVKKREPAHIFICGFSMGAMHATRYATEYDDVTAVIAVSHTMNVEKATKQLEEFPLNKFYLPNIMESHHRVLKKNQFLNCPQALAAKNMTELDTYWTAPSLGMSSCEEYWAHMTIYDKIPQFKVPIIQLVSEDDPFTRKSYFPYKEAELENNQNMVLVTTAEGGHCGFLEGMSADHTLVEDVAFEWFDKVAKFAEK